MRFTDWCRVRVTAGSDPGAAAALIPQARGMLGSLMNGLQLGEVPTGVMRRTLPGGESIEVRFDGTTPVITIDVPPPGAEDQLNSPFYLWTPRGLLVQPAGAASPRGWGLPVVQKGTDPYSMDNLDPGITTDRWTSGGAWPHVLLSRDAHAGIPTLRYQMMPVCYGRVPPLNTPPGDARDTQTPKAMWAAFRPRFAGFDTRLGQDPNAQVRGRVLFEAFNAYRDDHALQHAFLMPAGLYQPAALVASLIGERGLVQLGYPSGYQSSDQRLNRDGFWAPDATRQAELVSTESSAAKAMQAWDSAHPQELQLDSTVHVPLFADASFGAGVQTLALQERPTWLAAGRGCFQSADTGLPPVTWDAPSALNLAWQLLPLNLAEGSLYPAIGNLWSSGRFYLSYFNATYGVRAVLGPSIYCRGRVIGKIPNGGLVLGLGVRALEKADRLIVVSLQPEDNPVVAGAWQTHGFARYAHVWWHDFPRGEGMRLHSDAPVETWQDAGIVDVPGINYCSLWAFHPDGTRAVCLRDTATSQDIVDAVTSSSVVGARLDAWAGAFAGELFELRDPGTQDQRMVGTPLAARPYPKIGTEVLRMSPSLPGGNPAGVPGDAWVGERQLVPLAAAYEGDRITVAYLGRVFQLSARIEPTQSTGLGAYTGGDYALVGWGGTAATYLSDLSETTLLGGFGTSPMTDDACLAQPVPAILDFPRRCVLVDAYHSVQNITAWTPDPDPTKPYTVTWANSPAGTAPVLSTGGSCRIVRLFMLGRLEHQAAYPHPYGVLWAPKRVVTLGSPAGTPLDPSYSFTFEHSTLGLYPMMPDMTLQPFFAQRFDDYIAGYQVGLALPVTTLAFGGVDDPNLTDYSAAFADNLLQTIVAEDRPVIGGAYLASFDVPAHGGEWLGEAVAV